VVSLDVCAVISVLVFVLGFCCCWVCCGRFGMVVL